jgi:hypothetical protein
MGHTLLEKIGAYFKRCNENFVTEGQVSAMLSPRTAAAPLMRQTRGANVAQVHPGSLQAR